MKQINKKIKLALVAVIAIMAMAFLSYTPRVYADSYATTPQVDNIFDCIFQSLTNSSVKILFVIMCYTIAELISTDFVESSYGLRLSSLSFF